MFLTIKLIAMAGDLKGHQVRSFSLKRSNKKNIIKEMFTPKPTPTSNQTQGRVKFHIVGSHLLPQ